jgi:hypothetical protein
VTLKEWKSLEITQVVMAEFKRRQAFMKEQLAEQAGLEPLADREKVGAIKAYQDFLDIELEEETL